MADIPISKMVVPGSNDTLVLKDGSAANKVQSATSGNLASLDGNGNLADSGWKSDKTTTAVSGNPINITGLKTNQLAIDPIITLEPIQAGSGDPSPSNVRAISGRDKLPILSVGNKNVWSKGNVSITTFNRISIDIASGTYTFSAVVSSSDTDSNTCLIRFHRKGGSELYYDLELNRSSGTNRVSQTITLPHDIDAVLFYAGSGYIKSQGDNATFTDIQLELGDEATTFEPFKPLTDIQLQFGQTVYGGTLDLKNGVLTVDRGYEVYDGSSDENWSQGTYTSGSRFLISPNLAVDESAYGNVISNYLLTIYTDIQIVGGVRVISNNRLDTYWDSSLASNITELRAYLSSNPLQVCYTLATPIEIQLTPHEISLLKDAANVSIADAGASMSFSYHNGEVASLGDVEALGRFVEKLGIMRVIYTFDSAVTVSAQSANGYDVDSVIPDGYQPISVIFDRYASQVNTIIPSLVRQNAKWYAYLYNYYTTNVSIQPRLYIYCIKL